MRGLADILSLGLRRKSVGSKTFLAVQDEDKDARQIPNRVSIDDLLEYIAENLELPAAMTGGGGGGNTVVIANQWACDVVTLSGTSGTLSKTPSDASEAFVFVVSASGPDLPLTYTAGAPGTNQFSISGTTISVGATRANATLKVLYQFDTGTVFHGELLSVNAGGVATLAFAPTDASKAIMIWKQPNGPGIPLTYKASSPGVNEFTVSGVAAGFGRINGEVLAHYPIG